MRNKAQTGLTLVKKAIIKLVKQTPGGISSSEIATDLGLESENPNGEQKGWMCWGILQVLQCEKKLKKIGRGRGAKYFINK